MNSPSQEVAVAPTHDMNRFAPGRPVSEGKRSKVIQLTWVRGSGTSTIQLSNFNYFVVRRTNSNSENTYRDAEFALLV